MNLDSRGDRTNFIGAWRSAAVARCRRARATITAAGGRPGDLEAAIAECREVLAGRLGNTDRAWDHLAVVKAMLNGRLARVLVPPATRHVAQNPRRPARTPRFLRARA
jgi:hypothetical protein